MQSESSARGDLSARPGGTARGTWATLTGLLAVAAAGCPGGGGPGAPPTAARPFAGTTLRVACADPAVAAALRQPAAAWGGRTGATVTVVTTATDDPAADVLVVRPAEVGARVARGDARPVPKELRAEDQPARWSRLLPAYRDRLTAWGGEVRAVPLAGDGYVLAYRADTFARHAEAYRAKTGRALEPPATWEAVAEVAEFFADAEKGGSLPPLPADPDRLLREFHFVAACFDRPALTESAVRGEGSGRWALSFHHDVETGRPRLTAPGFAAAAGWLARVNRCRGRGADDPVAALDGGAVLAVLTLAEVGRLPRDGDAVAARFGIAPLPGTRHSFDPATGAERPPADRARGVNFVPFYGAGGWVAVVREKCPAPEAAFDLLADLAGPARSLDLLTDPGAGLGPFRAEHLEQQRQAVWQRYALDPARSQRLADALRQYTALTLANPAFAYRGPDQAGLMAALEAQVRRAATGQVAAGAALAAAQEAWLKADAAHPPAAVAEWRRKSAGLE